MWNIKLYTSWRHSMVTSWLSRSLWSSDRNLCGCSEELINSQMIYKSMFIIFSHLVMLLLQAMRLKRMMERTVDSVRRTHSWTELFWSDRLSLEQMKHKWVVLHKLITLRTGEKRSSFSFKGVNYKLIGLT